jgi:RNA polymerase sigma-70 factor (TIGR02943 family)
MSETVSAGEIAVDVNSWVDQHGDALYRYTLLRLRDSESAEEVVQETFLAGLKAVAQFSGKGTERAWLLGILKRKIVDHVRKRSRGAVGASDEAEDVTELLFDTKGNWKSDPRMFGDQPSAALERNEFWRVFHDCLSRLPNRQADAFALRELEGFSTPEIQQEMDVSATNLGVMLYRARMRLSNCIQSHWRSDEESRS